MPYPIRYPRMTKNRVGFGVIVLPGLFVAHTRNQSLLGTFLAKDVSMGIRRRGGARNKRMFSGKNEDLCSLI
jgi:hypothetical protein